FRITKIIISSIIVILVIIADQISKYFVQKYLIINCNKGVALGIGENVLFLVILVLLFVFLLIIKEKNFIPKLGLIFIFSGGISNLLDRMITGCVRDFIAIVNLPSFNLADLIITVGVLIIVVEKIIVQRWHFK
ncbi:hypothetical protein A2164_04305, partial [Candidatus Curtissbacteria bacterium RBG_13_35_7]